MSSPPPSPAPGGEGQALPIAGILCCCAASQSPSPAWLRAYLARVLGPSSPVALPPGAAAALTEQAVELTTAPEPLHASLAALDGYLSASSFAPNEAVPLMTYLLQADVVSSTAYDARAREALMRVLSALRLPPRVLFRAEADLAALMTAVEANATKENGRNVEAVDEDLGEQRRRKNLKWIKIGTAGVVGGLALGLSGGLIAPALLPALGSVGLAGVSAPLAALGGGGAYAVGGLFGAAGVGVGAAAMSGRTGAVEDFSFEPCTVLGHGDGSRVKYDKAKVTPAKKVHEVVVPLSKETGVSIMGGLLVWELLTYQDYPMVVPGGAGFGVQFRQFASRNGSEKDAEWLLPEEEMDAGGLDKLGQGRKRRTTGAITVQGNALVPPGKDPPVWIMEDNEYQPPDLVTGDARSLSMAILVPGLVDSGEGGSYPGMFADQFTPMAEALAKFDIQSFALRWEANLLTELSDALRRLIGKMALSAAAQNGAMMLAPALIGAVALPVSIIAAIRTIIGNIWAKVISRASECGYMLAAELASRSFGNRPVCLAGYSAGALVVFSCLQELARRQLLGIVHDVFLVGAPCSADAGVWQEVRKVVSGRLVNAYNPNDWYLELYHRGTNLGAVAGTRPIHDPSGKANVENICLSADQVQTHMEYAKRCSSILLEMGFGDAERRRPWMKPSHKEKKLETAREEIRHQDPAKGDEELFSFSRDFDDEVVVFKAMQSSRSQLNRHRTL